MGLTRVTESMTMRQAREGLTNYLLPSSDGGWRDIYRSGWLPSWFNQQWGGAQWGTEMQDAATGVTYKFDVATGQIEDNWDYDVSRVAGNYFEAQGFMVSENITNPTIWLKLLKAGNPTFNLTVSIRANSAGAPTGSDLMSTTLSTKVLTSNTTGDWYAVTLTGSLTANTQYHLILSSLAAVDNTNYIRWKATTTKKYPFGNINQGTSVPAWTPTTTSSFCFLVANQLSFLQASGQFDKKLVFSEGTPVNQSKSLAQPMKNFFDGQQFTYLVRGASFAKGKPIADFVYGLDHDRISLTTHGTSGVGILTVYDKTGVSFVVTGTTDLSTVGTKDIAIAIRSKGDSSDYIKLYVNGVVEGVSVTGQAINFDPLFRDLGTAWIGGGFAVAPTWTIGSLSNFNSLPSANGWTWSGTTPATEANAISVYGGKLYQNKNAYGSTNDGYYIKSSAGFSNSTGWTICYKVRPLTDVASTGINSNTVVTTVCDGTKQLSIYVHEFWIDLWFSPTNIIRYQYDFKSSESSILVCGKGSDAYVFINGKLICDGTGQLVTANATNGMWFGDTSIIAGESADAIWSYVKYYTGGALVPQTSTGASVSETVYWSGDKTAALKDLYNSGTPISAKTYMGFEKNYVGEGVVRKETKVGVTATPSTSSTTPVQNPELETYVIGSEISLKSQAVLAIGSAGGVNTYGYVDGTLEVSTTLGLGTASYSGLFYFDKTTVKPLGLHKVESRYSVNTSTGTNAAGYATRYLTTETRS